MSHFREGGTIENPLLRRGKEEAPDRGKRMLLTDKDKN